MMQEEFMIRINTEGFYENIKNNVEVIFERPSPAGKNKKFLV